MPRTERIVINTGPLIALVAALGNLNILKSLYKEVLVPLEVNHEILAGGPNGFAVDEFKKSVWLNKWTEPLDTFLYLRNSLDIGESAVIQLALNQGVQTVCIDEAVGRRVARLNGLSLTGSIGILIRAKREGHPFIMEEALIRMRSKGIWLSERVITSALKQL